MATIRLSGLPPYDGEYPMPTDLDFGELIFIEKNVHVRAGEVEEALAAGSVGVLACIVAIALKRAGKPNVSFEALTAPGVMKPDNIEVEGDEEVEEVPPASATPNGSVSLNGVAADASVSSGSSGSSSSDAGGRSGSLPVSGSRGLGESAVYGLETSNG